ncbi:MAG: ribonuclease D [Cellvibrionaceae bacterium]
MSAELSTIVFEWVDNDQRLAELSTQWQQQAAIALDTEFIRSRTFFPKVGLLQIADSNGIYLIDPLAISDINPLKDLLQNPLVTKIIHSCSEDLEVFQHYLSVLPAPLFDTQIAAAFAGYGASIGYANLVSMIQGDVIPKQETRSDWMQRPLSQSQLDYAALDVEHLLLIHRTLVDELEKKDRLSWLNADCEQLLEKYRQSDAHSDYYQRVKSAWKLKPHQLAVLQDLCSWREEEARTVDIPRSHLVKDIVLLEMARRTPENKKQLARLREVQSRFIETYGDHCLQIVQQALENDNHPEHLPSPLGPEQVDVFKQLKSHVVTIADSLKVPPEFLARKKDLELLVRSIQNVPSSLPAALPATLTGWRYEVIGQPLLDYLSTELLSE